MDKIKKALRKLSEAEREKIKIMLTKISSGNFQDLDIKKLKGRNDIFRVRKSAFRIIYRISSDKIFILTIERRKENTYKF